MNDRKDKKSTKDGSSFNVEREDGLKIQYDKDHLEEHYPNLMAEIFDKKQSLSIDSIQMNEESEKKQSLSKELPKELTNPGAIDFLRRCKKDEEAFEILKFLLTRNEITKEEYDTYKAQISKENGLKELVNSYGGLKKPGYYERKYYKSTKLNSITKDNEINKT